MPSRGESSCNRAAALAPHLPASMKVPHTQFVTLSRAWTSAVLRRLPHGLCGMRVSLQIQVALKQPHRDTPRQAAPSGCSPVHSELLSSSTGYGSLDPDLLHFTPHLSSGAEHLQAPKPLSSTLKQTNSVSRMHLHPNTSSPQPRMRRRNSAPAGLRRAHTFARGAALDPVRYTRTATAARVRLYESPHWV